VFPGLRDTIRTSDLQNPSHAYSSPGDCSACVNGTYDVLLTAANSLLDSDTETRLDYTRVCKAPDANGVIDNGDVTKIERIILRIDWRVERNEPIQAFFRLGSDFFPGANIVSPFCRQCQ